MGNKRIVIIAISGGSGSGKSTISRLISRYFRGHAAIVHTDDFYRHVRSFPLYHGIKNFDHPNSIDFLRLIRVVAGLKRGKRIVTYKYLEIKKGGKLVFIRKPLIIRPKPIVIVEGLFTLASKSLRDIYDVSFYLELIERTRLARRSQRRTDSEYMKNVLLPMHNQFIQPTSKRATHVIAVKGRKDVSVARQVIKQINNNINKY